MPRSSAITKLQARPIEGEKELKKRIHLARKNIGEKVEEAAARPGLTRSKPFRDNLYGTIDGIYVTLGRSIDAWAKEWHGEIAEEWHNEAIRDIRSKGVSVPAAVVKFSRQRVIRYWEMVHPDNASSFAAVFTDKMRVSDINHLRQAFLDTWRQGQLEGWTMNEIHKNTQLSWDLLSKNMRGNRFVDSAGRQWTNSSYLQMLTRTTANRVSRDSYIDTLISDGDDLVRIMTLGDNCQFCNAWKGRILSMTGKTKGFPTYQDSIDGGVWHPNCDCRVEYVDKTVDAKAIAQMESNKKVDWTDVDAVAAQTDELEAS